MTMISKQIIASKILAYLKHEISLNELVNWAEHVLMEDELETGDEKVLVEILGQLGLADVRAFGLTWEDCETMMVKLGYQIKVEASIAS